MAANPSDSILRRPAGLVLSGGGALGAWQGGVVAAMAAKGLRFDKVIGFSAGSLTGGAYFLNRIHELEDYWKRIDDIRVLRFAPKLQPFSLFSADPIREVMSHALDEAETRKKAICEFIIMSRRMKDRKLAYGRFTPEGGSAWDGPFVPRIVASCSIPKVFPPAPVAENGEFNLHVDGGLRGGEWMKLDLLADCKDILCVEMVRPDEVGIRRWSPVGRYDQFGREVCREHINQAVLSLAGVQDRPRVFRLAPSRVLPFRMLAFKRKNCVPAFELGSQDAELFLKDPSAFAVSWGAARAEKRLSPESAGLPAAELS